MLPWDIVPTSPTRSVLRPRAILPRQIKKKTVAIVLLRSVLTTRENIVFRKQKRTAVYGVMDARP